MNGFLTTIVLLGAVQGMIAAGLLYFSARNRRSNRFLAWIILLIALACYNMYANGVDYFGSSLYRFLDVLIPTVLIMPIGPLIWFYTRSTLDPGFKTTRKHRLHFTPVFLDIVPSLAALIFVVGVLTLTLKNNPEPWGIFIDHYNTYADIPRWLSMSLYTWLSFRLIQKKNGQVQTHKWLRQFIWTFLIFQSLWLIYLVPYVIPRYTDWMLNKIGWTPVYLPLVIMIYWLSIKGFMISWQTGMRVKKPNGITNSLTGTTVNDIVDRLQRSMREEKLYLNPGLNLQLLSQHTGLPQKAISSVLNQHIHKSFNAFVNEYRVEEFKQKIKQADTENLTMAGIAADCGFNSQATFQRTFKEITGMSPSEFRKSVTAA